MTDKLNVNTIVPAGSSLTVGASGGSGVIADDVKDLLTKIDSQTAETSSGPVVLETEGVGTRSFEKNILEHFLEETQLPF